MDIEQFWRLTLPEVGIYLDGADSRRNDRWDECLVTAHQAAAFVSTVFAGKKLPDLRKLLARGEAKAAQPQSARDVVDMWRDFFRNHGSGRTH